MLAIVLLFAARALYAVDVVYIDGIVDIRYASGELAEALIGDSVTNGDTIITGDGRADLEPGRGSLIRIAPDTIFTLRELEIGSSKRSVLSTTLGAVRFTFDRIVSDEPLIATPGTVAGIRGTELEVFAGADGSILFLVYSGAIELSAAGQSIELGANEGVEVPPGSPPGEKFEVLRGQLDFSSWNGEREARILQNPLRALEAAQAGLDSIIAEIEAIVPLFEENQEALAVLREQLRKEEDAEKRKRLYEQEVFPLEIATSYLALNRRYHALSALSYRRYVLGTIYLRTRMQVLSGNTTIDFKTFAETYQQILGRFERFVTPYLVPRDI